MDEAFPTAPKLPTDVLTRRIELPKKPAGVTLAGPRVRLEPLQLQRDVDSLFTASSGSPVTLGGKNIEAYDADALIWRYMSGGPFANA